MKRLMLSCENFNKLLRFRKIENALIGTAIVKIRDIGTASHYKTQQANSLKHSQTGCNRIIECAGKRQNYVTTAILHGSCWNCGKVTMRKELMFCSECGHLQDVDNNINYFDVLSIPHNFTVERRTLTKRFRQLQSIVHPDKFSRKSDRERTYSAAWSSYLNAAYKTLLTPLERAQYLLQLRGQIIKEENTNLDSVFLMEMMERNEQVEEAKTEEALKEIHKSLLIDQQEKVKQLTELFKANDLEGAKIVLIQMKYLKRVENAIKNKLQGMILKL